MFQPKCTNTFLGYTGTKETVKKATGSFCASCLMFKIVQCQRRQRAMSIQNLISPENFRNKGTREARLEGLGQRATAPV